MKGEEILNRYCEKECKDFLQCGYSNKKRCPYRKGIKYGLAEGRKEGYELGKNNERKSQCGKKNYEKDIARLEKENAELSNSVTELTNTKTELKSKITELEKQVEKMKCCGNCKNIGSDSEIGENGDYTDYTCIQCDDFSTKEKPYPNWELAE